MRSYTGKLLIFSLTLFVGVVLSSFALFQDEIRNNFARFSAKQAKTYNPDEYNWGNDPQKKCAKTSESFSNYLSPLRKEYLILMNEKAILEQTTKKSEEVALLKKKIKAIKEKYEKEESKRLEFKESNPNHSLLFMKNCSEY